MTRWMLMLVLCAALATCRSAHAPPAGTGSREVVTNYFEALAREDWATAYAQLHADTQKSIDRPDFERRARAYCQGLGFPLGKVVVRSCDEQGDKAIAQVILADAAGAMKHRYREGAVLERGTDGWGIVLPSNFGQAR